MDIKDVLPWIATGITVVLFAFGIIAILLKEGRIEVDPFQAVVVKNIWFGSTRAIPAGTDVIVPGWEKRIETVTLKDEPKDVRDEPATAKDGAKIVVRYITHTQRVEDPVKAATAINYQERDKLIATRIKGYIQNEVAKVSAETELVEFERDAAGKITSRRKANLEPIIQNIEREVDRSLELILNEWGINVKIEVADIVLPDKLTEVIEEAVTAEREGYRIKAKAEAAGVAPQLMVLGDIISDAARVIGGIFKKGGK